MAKSRRSALVAHVDDGRDHRAAGLVAEVALDGMDRDRLIELIGGIMTSVIAFVQGWGSLYVRAHGDAWVREIRDDRQEFPHPGLELSDLLVEFLHFDLFLGDDVHVFLHLRQQILNQPAGAIDLKFDRHGLRKAVLHVACRRAKVTEGSSSINERAQSRDP